MSRNFSQPTPFFKALHYSATGLLAAGLIGSALAQAPEAAPEPAPEPAAVDGVLPDPQPQAPLEPELFGPDPLPEDPRTKLWAAPVIVPKAKPPELPAAKTPVEEPVPPADFYYPLRNDPIARTAFFQARTGSDTLFEGLGGVPNPLQPVFLGTPASERRGMRYRALSIQPSVGTGLTFNQTEDSFASLSGSLAASLARPGSPASLALNYGLSFNQPTGSGSRSVDQALTLSGNLNFVHLQLGIGIVYTRLSAPDTTTDADQSRDTLTLSLTSTYKLAPKTSLDWDLVFPIDNPSNGARSAGVTSVHFLNYQYDSRTDFGIGGAVGVSSEEQGPDQHFEQLLLRMGFESTRRVRLNATAGIEWRDTGFSTETTPVFGMGLSWHLNHRRQLIASADRRVASGGDSLSNSYTLSLIQNFGRACSCAATLGYERTTPLAGTSEESSAHNKEKRLLEQIGVTVPWGSRWQSSVVFTASQPVSSTGEDELQLALNTSFYF